MGEILGVLKEKQLSLRAGKQQRSKEILGITEQGEMMEALIKPGW